MSRFLTLIGIPALLHLHAAADPVRLGAGAFRDDLPPGADGKPRRSIEASPLVSENLTGPVPTNDWWSSLVWPMHSPHSMPMFPHPLAVQAHADGLGIGYTSEPVVSDHLKDGTAFQVGSDYRYPYRESLRIGLEGMETSETLVDHFSDWAVTALWEQGDDALRATFAHGSPFVFFERTGDRPLQIKFRAAKVDATRQPVAPLVAEWKNITAKHSGSPGQIELAVNAGEVAGIGTRARLVYDFDGDGKTDRVETFGLFATDPIADSWETYTSEKQKLDPGLSRGEMRDFENGSIRLEFWKCFGEGTVELDAGKSKLSLPDGSTRNPGTGTRVTGDKKPGAADVFVAEKQALGISINGSHFGIFAPAGTELAIDNDSIATNLAGKDYLSVAVLPDASPATFKKFQAHAYAFLRDTKVSYRYKPSSSSVTTTFAATTETMEGNEMATLFALYRHQHLHATEPERFEAATYASPRGEMKVIAGSSFSTETPFLGVLPSLPNPPDTDAIRESLARDAAGFQFTKDDTYWNGKEFGKASELIQIAEQLGEDQIRDQLLEALRSRLEDWFDAKEKYFFHYDQRWNTLTGYPDSYGSAEQLNDHHFHYSYFIRAAATIAQYDPDWVKPDRYGEMIDALIRDCASYDRDDRRFPWMRSFDPYAGHSWAAGHAGFASGNNQESSSESMNFATSLILYGQAIGDETIRDLGIYWHSTEAEAIRQYWFDQDGEVFPDGFQQSCVGMVWGDGASYGTWWTANPEEIHGINFLPINGGSLYLGRDANYVERNLQNLKAANRNFHTKGFDGDPETYDRWQDILTEYLALADPGAAMEMIAGLEESELGETKTHTLQWIMSLGWLGKYDAAVRANHASAVAFENAYVIYNASGESLEVKFTDGKIIPAPPGLTSAPRQP